ncbi:MAG: hypothetical protein KatS3mg115_1287 [Candidatus Poribacteria bacterium]|nr:MAG: hypothetical protein KatS3mg115_1287 [Candidatus Poribacteria bacterium]
MPRFWLRDLYYRRLRVVLTVLGVALLSMLILLLGGIMNGLRWQAQRYVRFVGADAWISKERSGGVFVGFTLLDPEDVVPLVQAFGRGVMDERVGVSPLIFAHARPVVTIGGVERQVKAVVVGYRAGKLGGPSHRDLVRGRLFVPSPEVYSPEQRVELEAVVDESLGVEIGQSIEIGGYAVTVVGIVRDMMFVFDTPLIFMDIRAAQETVLENVLYVNTFLVKAAPGHTAEELVARLNDPDRGLRSVRAVEVHTSEETIETILTNYVTEPMRGVQFLRVMLWLTAALIVGMISYVTTMEKTQELGVMKAIGADNRYVLQMVLLQVLLTSVVGVALGVALALIAAPAFPIFVLVDPLEGLTVSLLSVLMCLLGGSFAAWRATRVDPMIAFRGEL